MKKIFFVSMAGLLLAGFSHAQDKKKQDDNNRETIEGNGKLTTRDVSVSSFDALQASGVYELKLSQGSKESVKIEADENLQEYFNVHNDGNKLVIDMEKLKDKNLHVKNKMKVYVTFKNLKELDLKTVGNVSSEEQLSFDDLDLNTKSVGNVDLNLTAKKLNLDSKSVGDVKLKGKADEAVVRHKGVGSLQASNFVVQTMDIECDGVGGAEVNAAKNLKVKDSFLGKVKNKGAATPRKMNKVRV
jgi:Putative auto-transporter adhesin, head GIN domain